MPVKEFTIILQIAPVHLAICKLPPHEPLPAWLNLAQSKFFSITKTKEEFSIVCEQAIVPEEIHQQKP